MITAQHCINIFNKSINDYHVNDDVDFNLINPHPSNSIDALLYLKNWIDTVQWHLEDIIRDPNITDEEGMKIKRRIDASNQNRTDTVEHLEDYLLKEFQGVATKEDATMNTESPGWAIDRISILCLKIYHMQEQVNRADADIDHKTSCQIKLNTLLEQQEDLISSFDMLMREIAEGKKVIKVYRQMKMYNDDSLNPILYKKKA